MDFVFPSFQVLSTPTPGAMMSTQVPLSEKDANLSEESEAATVIAVDARAGLFEQASRPLLPAATA